MSTPSFLLVSLAILGGVVGAFQAAANASLGERLGFPAAVLAQSVVLLGASAAWWALAARAPLWRAGTAPSLYLGGLFGFGIIACVSFVFAKIGGAFASALIVLGQGLAALAIDHLGLWSMPQAPVTAGRLGGVALVTLGVLLLAR